MNYLSSKEARAAAPVTSEPHMSAPLSTKASPEMITTFSAGMLIAGNIVCAGAVHIFGRVTGDIYASSVVICEGAKVEGNVTVQEAVIQGTFKGVMHGSNIKLLGTAVVEGEIFNRSLTIEPNALFEGVSRRLERPVPAPTMEQIAGETTSIAPAAAPALAPVETIAFREGPVALDNELFA